MKKKTTYLHALTPLRGIAAIWVMIFHIEASLRYRNLGTLIDPDATGIVDKGYLWVDFFFLLSGFIIAHVYGQSLSAGLTLPKARAFLWARFTRIYPLHLFVTLVLVVAVLLVPLAVPEVQDGSWGAFFNWSALPYHLAMVNASTPFPVTTWNMPSWSIGAEWWAYVVALLLFPLFAHRHKTIQILATVAAFAGLIGLWATFKERQLDLTFDYGWLRCLLEFPLGVALYRLYDRRIGASLLSRDPMAIGALVAIGMLFHFQAPDIILVPVFGWLILAAAHNRGRVARVLEHSSLRYLGDISYSIYLVHGVWFLAFWFIFTARGTPIGEPQSLLWWQRIAYVLVFVVLTVATSHFTYHYFEVAARQYLRRRFG